MDFAPPLAHVGHWLWVLYVPPILIVVASIVRTTISERRGPDPEQAHDDEGTGGDDPSLPHGAGKEEH